MIERLEQFGFPLQAVPCVEAVGQPLERVGGDKNVNNEDDLEIPPLFQCWEVFHSSAKVVVPGEKDLLRRHCQAGNRSLQAL